MVLKFTRTERDYQALVEHFYDHSETVRAAWRRNYWIGAIFGVLSVASLAHSAFFSEAESFWRAPLTPIAFGTAVGAMMTLFTRPLYRRRYRRNAMRIYQETKNVELFGPITLTLLDEGLESRFHSSTSVTHWGDIERVDESEDYTFVYTSSVMAIVIPRNNISEGDYAGFVSVLQVGLKRYRASKQEARQDTPTAE